MVQVRQVRKRFGTQEILKGISLEAKKGQVLTLLGPNGSGKTTLMRILSGVLSPTEGEVWIEGYRMDTDPLEAKRRLGYLPEQSPYYAELTVEEYLDFVADAKGVPVHEKTKRVAEALERCDIGEYRGKRMGVLSKGTLRRVGIAQAIVNHPSVLVLDEPTSGLDPSQALSFRQLILEQKSQSAIILSTHLLHEASSLSSRVLFIRGGRIVLEDSVEGLNARFMEKDAYQVRVRPREDPSSLDAEESIRRALSAVPGIEEVSVAPLSGGNCWDVEVIVRPGWNPSVHLLPLLLELKWEILELSQKTVDLEEIFGRIAKNPK